LELAMKRLGLLTGIAVALVILLALLFVYPHQMIAPGALMPGHKAIESDCFACHAPLQGASSARCMTCHKPAEIGVKTVRGVLLVKPVKTAAFHAMLQQTNCTACHSDHAANLLAARPPKAFDHSLLRPAAAAACSSCHAKPAGALHAKIERNCATCHKTSGWKPASFAHDRYFQLDRAHNVTCTTCHINNVYTRSTCYGCHEHQPAQMIAEHAKEGIRNIENCVRCHRSAEGEGGGGEEGDD
jgi:hypothetical protein